MSICEIDHVSKTYGTGAAIVHAIRDISLTIDAGEFTAFVGPSGSGKTTLLNQVGRLCCRCLQGLGGLHGRGGGRRDPGCPSAAGRRPVGAGWSPCPDASPISRRAWRARRERAPVAALGRG